MARKLKIDNGGKVELIKTCEFINNEAGGVSFYFSYI